MFEITAQTVRFIKRSPATASLTLHDRELHKMSLPLSEAAGHFFLSLYAYYMRMDVSLPSVRPMTCVCHALEGNLEVCAYVRGVLTTFNFAAHILSCAGKEKN